MGSSMSFPKLKKAVSGISSLEYLSLPTSMELTHTDETVQWPSSLTEMEIGGRIDEALMWSFCWPPRLETLTIDHCILAEGFDTIGTVLSNKQLRQGLRRLIIGQNNESIWDSERQSLGGYYLLIMENLFYMKIPAHIAAYLFGFVGVYPRPISGVRAMEITSARHGQDLDLMDDRFPYEISEGLQSHFVNIWSLVVSPSVGGLLKERQHDIDDEIWLHLPDDDLNSTSCSLHGIDLVDFELKHVLGLSVGGRDN
ncbi:hypothetical protein VI817_002434 [Penicillium citrinum]|nr:hypothetical protein VI817_002434 [Penicillium citrinum]